MCDSHLRSSSSVFLFLHPPALGHVEVVRRRDEGVGHRARRLVAAVRGLVQVSRMERPSHWQRQRRLQRLMQSATARHGCKRGEEQEAPPRGSLHRGEAESAWLRWVCVRCVSARAARAQHVERSLARLRERAPITKGSTTLRGAPASRPQQDLPPPPHEQQQPAVMPRVRASGRALGLARGGHVRDCAGGAEHTEERAARDERAVEGLARERQVAHEAQVAERGQDEAEQ